MGDTILSGCKLYIAGRDLSSNWTAIRLKGGRESVEWTKGQDGTRVYRAGLRVGALEVDGVVDLGADLADEELYNAIENLSGAPAIVGIPGATSGEENTAGYALEADIGDYTPVAGEVGERLNFTASARCSSRLVRGTFMHDGDTARTATANGTARQLGAVATGKKLYACLMVLSASAGDTLDVVIARDNAEGFPSGATAATFTQKTTTGEYEWIEVDGPITDDWWRVQWTIAGNGSESFNFVVLLAIQ